MENVTKVETGSLSHGRRLTIDELREKAKIRVARQRTDMGVGLNIYMYVHQVATAVIDAPTTNEAKNRLRTAINNGEFDTEILSYSKKNGR